jgi:DNA-binding NarL/FixJ family response regulator
MCSTHGRLSQAARADAAHAGSRLSCRRLASLTPTERDVARLVADGLANTDIATRLFISPRTVQSHLSHIYAKLGITSRVQLARQADEQRS